MVGRESRRALRGTVATVIAALVLGLAVRGFLVEPLVVEGRSMQNTLQYGERVLASRVSLLLGPLHYGAIVVFTPPPAAGSTALSIQRVIAVGGQTVAMEDGQVYVNGRKMPQPFLRDSQGSTKDHWSMPPFKVPAGDIWVLGDDRAASEDSRLFGFVKLSAVQGVVFWIFWPLSHFGPVKD